MKKKELTQDIASKFSLDYQQASVIINTVFNAIGRSLKKGENVVVTGFGTFKTRRQKACKISFDRKRYINVPATRVIDFSTGKLLKKLIRRKIKTIY